MRTASLLARSLRQLSFTQGFLRCGVPPPEQLAGHQPGGGPEQDNKEKNVIAHDWTQDAHHPRAAGNQQRF
jgi:hypothetical protein